MPEALATTKRKFYKALDALTTSTQGAPESRSPVGNERHAQAAMAFDEARERARKRLRTSASSSSLQLLKDNASTTSLVPRRLPATVRTNASVANPSQSPPNYSPWSQAMFLSRLKSFSSLSKWHPKPDAISEVVWAKRGWSCVDVNTVACRGGCEHRLVVQIHPDSSALALDNADNADDDDDDDDADTNSLAFEDALVGKYQSLIVDGHTESCLWRTAGCKDDIYRLQVIRSDSWQPELRTRLETLFDMHDSIADVHVKSYRNDDITTVQKLIADLPDNIMRTKEKSITSAGRALHIAAHGWRGATESGNQLLHCDACFQRIGLWMYQPQHDVLQDANRDSTRVGTETAETTPVEEPPYIDLAEMHRDHCPWRNSASQRAAGSLAGLNASEILQKMLLICARDHRRHSKENTKQSPVDTRPDSVFNEEDLSHECRAPLSRDEIVRQDKERESRIRKLKNMFSLRRRTPKIASGSSA